MHCVSHHAGRSNFGSSLQYTTQHLERRTRRQHHSVDDGGRWRGRAAKPQVQAAPPPTSTRSRPPTRITPPAPLTVLSPYVAFRRCRPVERARAVNTAASVDAMEVDGGGSQAHEPRHRPDGGRSPLHTVQWRSTSAPNGVGESSRNATATLTRPAVVRLPPSDRTRPCVDGRCGGAHWLARESQSCVPRPGRLGWRAAEEWTLVPTPTLCYGTMRW